MTPTIKKSLPRPDWLSPCEAVALYLRDCVPLLATMPDGCVDAGVTDPPYGIGEAGGKNKSRGKMATSVDYGDDRWDDELAAEAVKHIRRVTKYQIIFGGNYYALPPSPCWLVWDKCNGETDFADCELAWTNLSCATRLKRFMWHGMLRENGERRGDHPTQKPIGLMQWCLGFIAGMSDVVIDPMMGSGTTGVACVRYGGLRFIGIEREEKYFAAAVRRLSAELSQGDLFR